MSEAKAKTLRHIETVRNYINLMVRELLDRGEKHDQSKMEPPEAEYFEKFTPLLRGLTYGSPEYKAMCNQMRPAIDHHQQTNQHHPEYHARGIRGMTLIDLVELMCDWKASTMRSNDGNIFKSIQINQERFGYSDELKDILENTARWMEMNYVSHKAEES